MLVMDLLWSLLIITLPSFFLTVILFDISESFIYHVT